MKKISEKARAVRWLEERLAESPEVSSTLYAEGAAIDLSKTVLLRAAKAMDIVSISKPGEFGRMTLWHLPDQVPADVKDLAK